MFDWHWVSCITSGTEASIRTDWQAQEVHTGLAVGHGSLGLCYGPCSHIRPIKGTRSSWRVQAARLQQARGQKGD